MVHWRVGGAGGMLFIQHKDPFPTSYTRSDHLFLCSPLPCTHNLKLSHWKCGGKMKRAASTDWKEDFHRPDPDSVSQPRRSYPGPISRSAGQPWTPTQSAGLSAWLSKKQIKQAKTLGPSQLFPSPWLCTDFFTTFFQKSAFKLFDISVVMWLQYSSYRRWPLQKIVF